MSKIISIQQRAIDKFFEDDVLDFRNYPDEKISSLYSAHQNTNNIIDTSIIENETLRQQFKDLLKLCSINEKPYKHKSSSYGYLLKLKDFFASNPFEDFLKISEDASKALFERYCKENTIYKDALKIINSCQFYLFEYYDTKKGFNRDFWSRDMIHISKQRISVAFDKYGFDFRKITNATYREYAKKWIKYLLGSTELSYSTVINKFYELVYFLEYFKECDILQITETEIDDYIESFEDLSANHINKYIRCVLDFYKFLIVHRIYLEENPVKETHFFNVQRKDITNLVDETTVLQIFNHLHELPFDCMLIYLLDYTNGIRIGDILSIKADCLSHHDNVYNISYYCHKMKKDVVDQIPEELYTLLKQQVKIINNLDYKEAYLFPSVKLKNTPYNVHTYRNKMKQYMKKWRITNVDGTAYNFKTHAYRHSVATELYQNYNVSSYIIQIGILHHKEINMSLKYLERSDDYRSLIHQDYINNSGQFIKETDDKKFITTKWLNENIEKSILPNGICSYPSLLGTCPNKDICLTCNHFRTSKEFLNVHKEQLEDIERKIAYYKANKFLPNLETALKTKEILVNIIKTLEGGNAYASDSITT